MRRFLRTVRDALDRRLHPGRRSHAFERLRQVSPRSVLFVCLGNVCRSPYGERVLKTRTDASLAVDSAGFIGPGRSPPDVAIAAATARGIDVQEHVSKLLTSDLIKTADAIFVFDRHNARSVRAAPGVSSTRVWWLGDFDPQWAGRRAIVDPWGKPVDEFDRTFARIERCIDEVVRIVAEERSRD